MRRSKAIIQSLLQRESATSILAATPRQAEEWESFVVEERKALGVIAGCWPGEAGGGVIRAPYVIG